MNSISIASQATDVLGLDNHGQITPFLFVKVAFTSMVDWRVHTNILRANPNFYNRARYDYAIVQALPGRYIFAQILYIFQIEYKDLTHNLALILPMDVPKTMQNRARDNSLRLTRVQARTRHSSAFVNTNSIIRGALLVKDHASDVAEFHVVDTIDEDMFIRLKSIVFMNQHRSRHLEVRNLHFFLRLEERIVYEIE